MLQRKFVIQLAILISLMIFASASYAKYNPKIETDPLDGKSAALVVNGVKAITFLTNNGTIKPIERAKIAADRLREFAAKDFNLEYLSYNQSDVDARLMIDDRLLIIVTKSDAKSYKVSPAELASAWISNLKKAFTVSPLSATPTSMLVPLGETRLLSIQSLLTDPVEAEIADPNILSADPNPKPGSLVINGKTVGSSTITLKCGEYTIPINVTVKKYAAYLKPQKASSIVTGWNAPSILVERAARDAARRSLTIENGASINDIKVISKVAELKPGNSMETIVQVGVTGNEYIPAQYKMPIKVENKIMPAKESSWIMYSNNPEQIKKYQTLFTGCFEKSQESYRLLYHHQNMMGNNTGFVIEILNPSDKPASIHIIEGISDPMLDTVIVGYKAGIEFMDNHRNMIGRIIDLPASSRWVILSQSIPSPNTASGLIEFRQLSGEPLYVKVSAKPDALISIEDLPGISIPIRNVTAQSIGLSDHIYPQPEKKIETEFTIGKQWNFLRIGKNAIKHASQDKLLYGNYGVTYLINAKIVNPTDKPKKVEIAYEATAGPLSGIFYIDGQKYMIKMLKPPLDTTITTINVPANETKTLAIKTMPLSGSAYPSTLIIRPAGTIASASNR